MQSPTRHFDRRTSGYRLGALICMRTVHALSAPRNVAVAVPVLLNIDWKCLIHVDPLVGKDHWLAGLIQVTYSNK